MALTATAALVVTPDGNWNPDPVAGHAGWDNSAGDKSWVPDETYYRRVRLTLTGDAGEYINVVNWEIYDGGDIAFVADASTVTVQALGGDYTDATAPALLNNLATKTIWARNATAEDGGAPYYDETGTAWVSSLRANGPRTVIELPVYYKWAAADTDTTTFYIEAYLPGAGSTPSATTTLALANPDLSLIGSTGAPQPR